MEPILNPLGESIADAKGLEGLTRLLVEVLEAITGMESTDLTMIDERKGVQHNLYSRNTKRMQIKKARKAAR